MSEVNEAFVVEVAEWLETAAHSADMARVARRVRERGKGFVQMELTAHFVAGEVTGLEYSVRRPVGQFQADVGLTDEEKRLLRDFVAATPSNDITIAFEPSPEHGEVLRLSQLNYVPRGTTQQAIDELKSQIEQVFNVSEFAEDCTFNGESLLPGPGQ